LRASLRSAKYKFDEDLDACPWYCCLFADIARLWDSAIGEMFDAVLLVPIRPRDVLPPDHPLMQSAIREVEIFRHTTCSHPPSISRGFPEALSAVGLGLTACANLEDVLCEALLPAFEPLYHHYPLNCAALRGRRLARIIPFVAGFERRANREGRIDYLLAAMQELVIYAAAPPVR
jgi:hypothetical protein